jgi:hypothetical protein
MKTISESKTKKSSAPEETLSRTVFRQIGKQYTSPALPEDQSGITAQTVKRSKMQERLDEARIRELSFKHLFRICFSIFAAGLLIWQNYEVFSIIDRAFLTNQLQGLQVIFGTLIAATLTETYFILRIIVNFVFSLSDYRYEDRK